MVFKKLKKALAKKDNSEEYIEIDIGKDVKRAKILIKPFLLRSYDDVSKILNGLREGYTIAVIDIAPLKDKDLLELKRAISKIKKTVEALEGDIAGFGDSIIIATPNFAEIYKGSKVEKLEK